MKEIINLFHCDDIVGYIKLNAKFDPNIILIRYAGDEFILFSDKLEILKTCKEISVGFSEINGKIKKAINDADYNMLNSKFIFKNI